MQLYNRVNREELKKHLMEEPFKRKTISFYRYFYLDDPQEFRDDLYSECSTLNCFGRIYIAREGINAQMSVPEHSFANFMKSLEQFEILKDIPIKYAVEDDGKSFYKLSIKVRPKLVADGLNEGSFDVRNVGKHLSALEFHEQMQEAGTIVVDMRNIYESEIGHFEGAICPPVDRFQDELEVVLDLLKAQKDEKVLLYCTGGIRCEKASAYLKHHGFGDVNQLHGGIIEYARQIKKAGLKSKFRGKNFVFDARMGERINGQIISNCHHCGLSYDTHKNCANDACHLLFLQCPECASIYEDCCSNECKDKFRKYKEDPSLKRNTHLHRKNKYLKSLAFKSIEIGKQEC